MGFTGIIKAPESAFMFLIYPLKQRRITTKNTGTKKIASNVAETIPPITPIPLILRCRKSVSIMWTLNSLMRKRKRICIERKSFSGHMRKGESTGSCAGYTPGLSVGIWKNISATVILPAIRKKDFWN